jgi:hypothetical protein
MLPHSPFNIPVISPPRKKFKTTFKSYVVNSKEDEE